MTTQINGTFIISKSLKYKAELNPSQLSAARGNCPYWLCGALVLTDEPVGLPKRLRGE
jgi:hypothetical protein